MYKILSYLLVTILVVFFAGCNPDENSDTNSPENNNTYNVRDYNTNTVNISFTGTDSDNVSYEGNITREVTGSGYVNGVAVTIVNQEVRFALADGSWSNTTPSTWSYDVNGALLEEVINGKICTPDIIEAIPSDAKIGATGSLITYSCTDGTSIEEYWDLKDADTTNAVVTYYTTNKDAGGNVYEISTSEYTIDTNGTIISFHIFFRYPQDNSTMTLQSE